MDRNDADHQLWQHRPVRVEVEADAFVGVTPYLPRDLVVRDEGGGRFVIAGTYGFDTFRDDSFVLLIDGQPRTFRRWEDIPEVFDNVIRFTPDPTHDLTFVFSFEKGGETLEHCHWVHHDMEPWEDRLRALVARETNGGWNARCHPPRRRRPPALLRHGPAASLARYLLQRDPDLP